MAVSIIKKTILRKGDKKWGGGGGEVAFLIEWSGKASLRR